jgi:hexaprenyl-diphosphate synthase
MAEDYSQQAIDALSSFPDSDAKDGLIEMATKTLKRQK